MVLAYVGPGAGLSALGALWALIASVGIAFGLILIWPFRFLIRKIRGKGKTAATRTENPSDG